MLSEIKQSKVIKEEILCEYKWFGMKHMTFTIGQKVVENYQAIFSPYKTKNKKDVDGVIIIPVIKYANKSSEVVMIANFRPPVKGFVLQFPGGIVESDKLEEDARREVREETGYIVDSFVPMLLPKIFADPWKSDDTGILYIGIINGDKPQNLIPQQLDGQQNIIVYKLQLDQNLATSVQQLATKHEYAIQNKVWSFCVGLAMKKAMQKIGVKI